MQTRLTVAQFPYKSFVQNLHSESSSQDANCVFRNALLALALYNSMRSVNRTSPQLVITHRIRNCVLIAQYIDANHSSTYQQELLRKFCLAASSLRYCWSYIFTLRDREPRGDGHVDQHNVFLREMNQRLEVALLVANGYEVEEVKKKMNRLEKMGKLIGHKSLVVYGSGARWDCGFDNDLTVCCGLYAVESEDISSQVLNME